MERDKITFELDKDLKTKFHIKCLEKDTKLGEMLIKLIQKWLMEK